MNPIVLIQLSENDKRILIAACLILILLFVLIGLLGSAIIRTMKWQGKKCDTLVSDVVTNHIVTTPLQLRKYAAKKNARYFIKQAWLPIILIIVGVLVLIIRNLIKQDWAYNPVNLDDGFGTLLFAWDFKDPDSYTTIFGITVLAKWPPLINSPHFVVDAIYAYIRRVPRSRWAVLHDGVELWRTAGAADSRVGRSRQLELRRPCASASSVGEGLVARGKSRARQRRLGTVHKIPFARGQYAD